MGQVTVTVNGRGYTIACDDGEEEHVRELAEFVDKRANELGQGASQVGEARLLLMAALMVADDLSEAYDEIELLRAELAEARESLGRSSEEEEARIDALARKLEDIAGRIEKT